MRFAAIGFGLALGLASALAANAAPFIPAPASADPAVLEVGACNNGFHLNRWRRCVPNRYSDERPRVYHRSANPRPYWRWNSPSDFIARDLNRQELGHVHSGGGVHYGPGIHRGY